MARVSKRQKAAKALVDREKRYEIEEAVAIVKNAATAKFDESVDIAIRLGVDPRKSDQMVRGSCAMPHGTGRKVRVLALAKGAKAKEAEQAGADLVGAEDMIEKIAGGWLEFDRVVATPDMMGQVGKVAKVLGPRGLMPNPKAGTVTQDLAKVIANIKAGQVEFRVDKAGILHVPVGRASFDQQKLVENISTLLDVVKRAKPSSAKGVYLKTGTLSTTMGPAVPLDPAAMMR
ncbi:MAG: 50S ribosomal protein L1 [SAR324 cluster bacterium]